MPTAARREYRLPPAELAAFLAALTPDDLADYVRPLARWAANHLRRSLPADQEGLLFDDLDQICWLAAARAAASWTPAGGMGFRNYVCQCAVRLGLQFVRTTHKRGVTSTGSQSRDPAKRLAGRSVPVFPLPTAGPDDTRPGENVLADRRPAPPDPDLGAYLAGLMDRAGLTAKERLALRLVVCEGRKLTEGSAAIGVTKERVRQLKLAALRKLREAAGDA